MTGGGLLLTSPLSWGCPNCWRHKTTKPGSGTPFHRCSGLGGLDAPLVPLAEVERGRVRVVANLREDYESKGETLTRDNAGRPIMSITTEHADGRVDCVVLAPCIEIRG